jgi:hypothetical protein
MAAKRGDTMTVAEAQRELGVSKVKMAKLLREGALHAEADPLDKRFKLIPRAEVDALKARSQRGASQVER